MVTIEVKTNRFSGPLEKLVELIEAEALPISEVSLAEVTNDFLEYLKNLEKSAEPGLIADFLVIAARLVLIKSRILLPDLELTAEEESEIKDLESRLVIYREFAVKRTKEGGRGTAAGHIEGLWTRKSVSYSRAYLFHADSQKFFFPASNLNIMSLSTAVERIIVDLKQLIPDTGKIKATIISLEEKIKELLHRCKEMAANSFRSLAERKSREEVVVMFLAVLHLLRDRTIAVEQGSQFGDIVIKRIRE